MEKRVIPTCVENKRLKSLIEELATINNGNSFTLKLLNRDEFLKSNLSFVITDEKIFSEIIEKKISFKQIILINYSGKSIQNTHKETEVISIDIPFRFSELNKIISNRLNLITSQNERVIKFSNFTYDPRVRSLFDSNFSIRFTEKESNIFEYLLNKSNQFVAKKTLLKEIWSYSENIDTHTLETHIYSLRKKISKNLSLKELINFEERKGYLLNKDIL